MKPLDAVYYLIIYSVVIIFSFSCDIIAIKVLCCGFYPTPAPGWRQEQDGRVTLRESWDV